MHQIQENGESKDRFTERRSSRESFTSGVTNNRRVHWKEGINANQSEILYNLAEVISSGDDELLNYFSNQNRTFFEK